MSIESSTPLQALRLTQLLRLNKQYETAQSYPDMNVHITNSEGSFDFCLDNHQRFTFWRMLNGRLKSSFKEGMGNIGYELIYGRQFPPPIDLRFKLPKQHR